eukprot:532787_1
MNERQMNMTVTWRMHKIWIVINDINIWALQKWMAHNLLKFCMAFKLLQCVVAIQVILVSLIDECIVVPVIECTGLCSGYRCYCGQYFRLLQAATFSTFNRTF